MGQARIFDQDSREIEEIQSIAWTLPAQGREENRGGVSSLERRLGSASLSGII